MRRFLLLLPLLAGCLADAPPPWPTPGRCKRQGPVAVTWGAPQTPPLPGGSFGISARLSSDVATTLDFQLIAPAELVLTGGAASGSLTLAPGQRRDLAFTVQVTQALAPATLTLAVTAAGVRSEHYVDVTAVGASPREAAPHTAVNSQGKRIIVP